ncbi:Ig-like domain-containing protein [Robinsoniella peoriensis]|uniref:Ig-like domain-containing protein n=1 Tax=Robinsoniella peoriensis TaxID=180332 RepID=UPI0009F4F7D2
MSFLSKINDPNVQWSSSNTSIVTVDNQGRVKAIQEGRANILAMSKGCAQGYCLVEVKKPYDH